MTAHAEPLGKHHHHGQQVRLGNHATCRPDLAPNSTHPANTKSSPPTAPRVDGRICSLRRRARAGGHHGRRGRAAHLPGMVAGHTLLPVIGVPIQSRALNGLDSLLSIVQMPAGVPVATMAIGHAGAVNAALFAVAILGQRPAYRAALRQYRAERARQVMEDELVLEETGL